MVTIEDLTNKTYPVRRQWIQTSQPPVEDVLEKYPSLKMRKIVSCVQRCGSSYYFGFT